jgi:hypothetical protein
VQFRASRSTSLVQDPRCSSICGLRCLPAPATLPPLLSPPGGADGFGGRSVFGADEGLRGDLTGDVICCKRSPRPSRASIVRNLAGLRAPYRPPVSLTRRDSGRTRRYAIPCWREMNPCALSTTRTRQRVRPRVETDENDFEYVPCRRADLNTCTKIRQVFSTIYSA